MGSFFSWYQQPQPLKYAEPIYDRNHLQKEVDLLSRSDCMTDILTENFDQRRIYYGNEIKRFSEICGKRSGNIR